jgi:hypothetical protein
LAIGLVSALVIATVLIGLWDKSANYALIVSAPVGLAIWAGWRPGGWLRWIEERNHDLDA